MKREEAKNHQRNVSELHFFPYAGGILGLAPLAPSTMLVIGTFCGYKKVVSRPVL